MKCRKALLMASIIAIFCASIAVGAPVCTTIQSGLLVYQTGYMFGQTIQTGVNPYGYNWQAQTFNGSYFNSYAAESGFPPYNGNDATYLAANPGAASHWAWKNRQDDLALKWGGGWLDNKDCDGDGNLDRHYGFPSYAGSGAWLTNHISWTVKVGGKEQNANNFIKIVAIPPGSNVAGPTSYFGENTVYLNGEVLGPQIWGEFVVIHYNLNDPNGDHGNLLRSEVSSGFGRFKP